MLLYQKLVLLDLLKCVYENKCTKTEQRMVELNWREEVNSAKGKKRNMSGETECIEYDHPILITVLNSLFEYGKGCGS